MAECTITATQKARNDAAARAAVQRGIVTTQARLSGIAAQANAALGQAPDVPALTKKHDRIAQLRLAGKTPQQIVTELSVSKADVAWNTKYYGTEKLPAHPTLRGVLATPLAAPSVADREIALVRDLPPLVEGERTWLKGQKAASALKHAQDPIVDDPLQFNANHHAAIEQYSGAGYGPMNKALRNGHIANGTANPMLTHTVNDLTAAIEKVTAGADVITWRGVMGRHPLAGLTKPELDAMIGAEITDAGFVSTSVRRGIAARFIKTWSSRTLLEIRVPARAKALYANASNHGSLNAGEMELILQRDTRMRVKGYRIEREDALNDRGYVNVTVIELEVIP